MGKLNIKPSTIFCHDNIEVLRGMNSGCVDLIYLDPPFNKNKVFTAPIGSAAEGASFSDIFREEDVKDEWVVSIMQDNPELFNLLSGVKTFSNPYNYCYCAYMAIRLLECRRVLKDSGSVYFHCDQTMSHYIKLLLDCVFGEKNFRNEITWRRYAAHSVSKGVMDNIADILLYYALPGAAVNPIAPAKTLTESEMAAKFPHTEAETGRRYQHVALEQSSNRASAGEARRIGDREVTSDIGWRWAQATFDEKIAKNPHLIYWTKTGRPRYKIYADEYEGAPMGNIWVDVPYLSSADKERTGYPTQKPLALLERIILASSNEGDLVLDPFCGCATACVAAEKLGRKWIGIDVSEEAHNQVKVRLKNEVPPDMYRGQPEFRVTPPQRDDDGADDGRQKFVYIISNKNYPGEYKVGVATDVKRRLNAYQTADPSRAYKVEFQHKTPHYNEIEKHIHAHFENRHEWVRGDLVKIKQAIKQWQP